MMLVFGADTGKATGACLLDCSGQRPRLVDKCAVEEDLVGVLDVRFFTGPHVISVVGIETPSQVFTHGRAKGDMGARIGIERALLVAREATGVVKTVAALRAPSAVIHEGQAHEVRRAVLGALPKKREDIDRYVAQMVPRLIDGWPARSNDHERDAAVAALWAWRRRAPLPIMPRLPRRRAA